MCEFFKSKKVLPSNNLPRTRTQIEWRTINGKRMWTTRNVTEEEEKEAVRQRETQIVFVDDVPVMLPHSDIKQLIL